MLHSKTNNNICLCVCVLDYIVRTTVATRRGMRKMRNERIAVERGQRSTTEEQCKWMATRYVSSHRGRCTQKLLLGRVLLFNWCRSLRLARRTWREKNSKTKERYFFKQNHSLPIMPWSADSHKSFTQFLPGIGPNVPTRTRRHVHDSLFKVGYMSFSQTGGTLQSAGAAAGTWNAPLQAHIQMHARTAVNKSCWTDRFDGPRPTDYMTHTCLLFLSL